MSLIEFMNLIEFMSLIEFMTAWTYDPNAKTATSLHQCSAVWALRMSAGK